MLQTLGSAGPRVWAWMRLSKEEGCHLHLPDPQNEDIAAQQYHILYLMEYV